MSASIKIGMWRVQLYFHDKLNAHYIALNDLLSKHFKISLKFSETSVVGDTVGELTCELR